MEEHVKAFADRLKSLREEKNLTLVELAEKTGLGISTLSQYENGLREVKMINLLKLISFFNVTADYLLGVTDVRKKLDKGDIMGKKSSQKNPNGMGSFGKTSDGRPRWRQMKDGQMREVSAKTPKELQEKIKPLIDLPITKSKVTVDEWFEKWLETYIKPFKKFATYDQYYNSYKNHIKPVIGKRKMGSIDSIDIQTVISKMTEYTKKIKRKNKETGLIEEIDTGKGLSSCTMKHCRKVMNIAFTKAVKDKIIPVNPVVDIEIPVKQAKPRKTLTIDELFKIFKAMGNSRWLWSVKFDLVTGLRRGELLALKWSDIDRKSKRITVDKSVSSQGVGDTKNSKVHYVPLSDKAEEYLEKQILMLKKEGNPTVSPDDFLSSDNLVFPNQYGEMLQPSSYYTLIARFSKKAGIKASPHCLRHSFVYYTKDTLTLEEIQRALGHAERTHTLEIYGDMLKDNSKETAKQVDSVFDKLDNEVNNIEREERVNESKSKVKKEGNVIEIKFGKAN